MAEKKLSSYTEKEFYDFITKIRTADFLSESAHDEAIYKFSQLTEHPDGWDQIAISVFLSFIAKSCTFS